MVIMSNAIYVDFHNRKITNTENLVEPYNKEEQKHKSGYPQGSLRMTLVSDFTWKAISMQRFEKKCFLAISRTFIQTLERRI